MDQSTFLSRALWSYRESEEYVDVILVCQDEPISAHIALLAPLLSSFGISFHCIEDLPDVLILGDLESTQIEGALKSLLCRAYNSSLSNKSP